MPTLHYSRTDVAYRYLLYRRAFNPPSCWRRVHSLMAPIRLVSRYVKVSHLTPSAAGTRSRPQRSYQSAFEPAAVRPSGPLVNELNHRGTAGHTYLHVSRVYHLLLTHRVLVQKTCKSPQTSYSTHYDAGRTCRGLRPRPPRYSRRGRH